MFRIVGNVAYLLKIMTPSTIVGLVEKVFVMVVHPRPALSRNVVGDPHLCEYATTVMTTGAFS